MTLTYRSAQELTQALQARSLSAVDLMEATLARIEAVNGPLNAIVGLCARDDLMAQARAKDAADPKGALHGLPIAVKDLVNVAGVVSTNGSPAFANTVPEADDLMASRMREAGAILIGKTNVPEFGLGSHTFNPVYGATRNPYDPSRTCGGSSGGAAVALAAGMVALADGSDMMGSLRNPATWNNVYGFRPSWGRVPGDAVEDTFLHQLATLGPMARSPADLAILLDVLSGPNGRVPHASPAPATSPLEALDPKGLRIGWLGDWGGAFAMEPGILDNAQAALKVFETLGCHVESIAPPFDADEMWHSWITLRSWAVGAGLDPLLRSGATLKDSAIWEIEQGRTLSAFDVHRASVIRSKWFTRAYELFQDYDALVLPSAQIWPFDVETSYPTEIAGHAMDTYHRWMQVVVPVSLIGLPALAVPAGFSDHGLPGGVQVFGPRNSDARILQLGQAYHNATQWPQQHPPKLEA